MADKPNYIKWIRSKVGHEKIILVFAGGCILNEEGKVLLQRRADTAKWGFPGGAIELGETPEMAVIREAKEETGLDVEVGNLIGIYTDSEMKYPSGDEAHSICIAYELKTTGGELFGDREETLELQYFALNELPELFCKQHEELAKDIIRKRKNI
ncbi:MAG: NUDIX hydrolase [Lachnospiraceae bacterium]|nr:NUDIX hydrolase [Lachnospiraceae bacterium]